MQHRCWKECGDEGGRWLVVFLYLKEGFFVVFFVFAFFCLFFVFFFFFAVFLFFVLFFTLFCFAWTRTFLLMVFFCPNE